MSDESRPRELTPEALEKAAGCLRTLAHPARLRMIEILLGGQHTVGELADECGIPGAQTSGHLGKMRDRGLLRCERRGREMHYSVEEEALAGILECMRRRFGVERSAAGRSARGRRPATRPRRSKR
jgi:DNA-binding transcriptional ArsR family regulator